MVRFEKKEKQATLEPSEQKDLTREERKRKYGCN